MPGSRPRGEPPPNSGSFSAARLRRAVPTGNPNSPDGAAGKGTPTSGRHRCAKRSERRVPRGSPDDAECRGPGREANHPRTRGPSLPPAYGGLCRPGTPTVQMAPLARERRPLVGTAARSAAKGVYHAAVQMTLNAGVPAERRTTPELGVLPAARLRRAVPAPTGRTGRGAALSCLCATLCERRLAERAKNNGSELCSLPA